jgi:hypothetical protein
LGHALLERLEQVQDHRLLGRDGGGLLGKLGLDQSG